MLIFNDFVFYRHNIHKNSQMWYCVKRSAVKIIHNRRGKKLAILFGYTFNIEAKTKKSIRWRCTNSNKCPARFTQTLKGGLKAFKLDHTHPKNYKKHKTYKSTLYWRCTVSNANCKAKLATTDGVRYARRYNGNKLATLNGYTFCVHYQYKDTVYWQCTMAHVKCKARFVTNLIVIRYVQKPNGKRLAILDGYTYCLHNKSRTTMHWRCTMGYNKCKANFVATVDDGDVKIAKNEHTHPPPTYKIIDGFFCTAWGKCKSKFTMLLDRVVKTIEAQHTHPPPGYKIINDIFYKF
ncbi:Uncharacterized protein OBRU01_09851 [Operophtera brumata]|uniref:FLYWCH-type domain-containing protein n=1 Tax=Operophtera brumata TaxID=104452 RepID=A0A0L7LEH4_OPEBR|nr:Uncharacterized protein OBRU01_09851 [Operophtera brumata]